MRVPAEGFCTAAVTRRCRFGSAEHERAALIEERRQMEAQRLELIQTRREEILQRAKAMGYRVKESKTNGQIRLVLVRNG